MYGGRWWLCKCDCGNTKETITSSLVRGKTFTCGCSHFGENSNQWKGYKCISGTFWINLKHSAKRRKIKVKITKKYAYQILEKQKFLCSLSGVPIQIHTKNEENTASLDRINSSKGYVEGNVQWVHKKINRMKMDMSDEEFRGWCSRITTYKTA